MSLEALRMMTEHLYDQFKLAGEVLAREKTELIKSRVAERIAIEARDVVQEVGQMVQQEAHSKIGDLVSRCLAGVFSEPYTFKVEFERKRNRTEARLVFVRDGYELPPEQIGGGVREVAAFALRTACLLLTKPPLRRLLVLDEPFGAVDKDKKPTVAELVDTLSQELGMQFIIITHDPEFEIGTVVEIS